MTGVTHLAAGAISSLLLLIWGDYSIYYLLLASLGGLFPDMDASEAKIHHLGFRLTKRGMKIKPFWLPAKIISLFFRHRGWIHSLLGMVIFTGILTGILGYFDVTNWMKLSAAFGIGYLSHLITDSMTITGVPLLYPLTDRHFHLLKKGKRIKTGQRKEKVYELLFLVLFGIVFVGLVLTGNVDFG